MRLLVIIAMAASVAGLAAELALIQPKDLATQVAAKSSAPVVIHVGPNLLYRGKHIPASVYAGPASKPEGLDLLKAAVEKLPRDREIVVYCGCCPWDRCPNVKPAMEMLQSMGFTHAKAMYVESNFAKDWTEKGYPVEAGTPRP